MGEQVYQHTSQGPRGKPAQATVTQTPWRAAAPVAEGLRQAQWAPLPWSQGLLSPEIPWTFIQSRSRTVTGRKNLQELRHLPIVWGQRAWAQGELGRLSLQEASGPGGGGTETCLELMHSREVAA